MGQFLDYHKERTREGFYHPLMREVCTVPKIDTSDFKNGVSILLDAEILRANRRMLLFNGRHGAHMPSSLDSAILLF